MVLLRIVFENILLGEIRPENFIFYISEKSESIEYTHTCRALAAKIQNRT